MVLKELNDEMCKTLWRNRDGHRRICDRRTHFNCGKIIKKKCKQGVVDYVEKLMFSSVVLREGVYKDLNETRDGQMLLCLRTFFTT